LFETAVAQHWYAASLAADEPHRHVKREECPAYYNEILAKTLLRSAA
jgi:hypothetical protein